MFLPKFVNFVFCLFTFKWRKTTIILQTAGCYAVTTCLYDVEERIAYQFVHFRVRGRGLHNALLYSDPPAVVNFWPLI